MTLEWNGDRAIELMRQEIARRLIAAGLTLVAAHKMNLNVVNPRTRGPRGGVVYASPAHVGDWPHKRTGNLQRNVIIEPSNPNEVARTLRLRVGLTPPAFYGVALAKRGWKGLLDTFRTVRGRIQTVLGSGGQATEHL